MASIEISNISISNDILNKWQNVVDIMAEILSVPSAIITRVDPPEIEVLRAAVVPENPYHAGIKVKMARHYCETTIQNRKKLMVNHAPTDPQWNTAPEIEYGMYAYLGYPILRPDGEIFGTICILDNKENPFGRQYEKVLEGFRELVEAHISLVDMNEKLKLALKEIRVLRGLMPICSICKRVRDDEGYWDKIETYVKKHSDAEFTHSICPLCAKTHYPGIDIYDEKGNVKV